MPCCVVQKKLQVQRTSEQISKAMSGLLDCDDQLEQFLAEHPEESKQLGVEDMIQFDKPHGLQLIDTVAQDHTISDAQCELDVALRDQVRMSLRVGC